MISPSKDSGWGELVAQTGLTVVGGAVAFWLSIQKQPRLAKRITVWGPDTEGWCPLLRDAAIALTAAVPPGCFPCRCTLGGGTECGHCPLPSPVSQPDLLMPL